MSAIPGCQNDAIDIDDFTMPAGLFALLVGEFGEPDEFIGKSYLITTRA